MIHTGLGDLFSVFMFLCIFVIEHEHVVPPIRFIEKNINLVFVIGNQEAVQRMMTTRDHGGSLVDIHICLNGIDLFIKLLWLPQSVLYMV